VRVGVRVRVRVRVRARVRVGVGVARGRVVGCTHRQLERFASNGLLPLLEARQSEDRW